MTTEFDYYDQNNKHDLAHKCMQKDERIKELEACLTHLKKRIDDAGRYVNYAIEADDEQLINDCLK